ncbi:MAG: Ig-like domain-containing protein, partial [Syntrophaceae bacterium]|nr:Ig-like domain-containing protein [Syntrophaceae bacterium]
MKRALCSLFVFLVMFPAAAFSAEELKIISATPQGNLNALNDAKAITITFNYPVVALSGIEKDLREGPITIMPEVQGKYRWMGTSTLSFIPDEPLAYSTRYVVQVKASITGMNGEVMAKDVNFSFVTPRPQIEQIFPYQNQEQITLQQPMFVRFNQPMDIKKAAPFITLTSETGPDIPLEVVLPDEEDIKQQEVYWLDQINERTFKILPQQPLNPETTYTLKMKAGLPGQSGNLGMAQAYELKFSTYNYFRAEGISPGRDWDCGDQYYPEFGIRISFSNPVNRDELLKHLRFTPEISFPEDYSYESNEFTLAPNFQPNTKYTLRLDAGLPDKYGNLLDKEAVFTFQTIDYAPYLTMPSGRMLSEAYLGTRFPVKIMNVYNAPLQMKAYRTPEDILKATKAMAEYNFEVTEPDVSREYRPNILKNKVATMPFDLAEVLHEDEETGIIGLAMQFESCNGESRFYNALIFLTELSVTAKFSAINNVFWVTRLKDSSALEGAEIELYDEKQKFLWKGVTDTEGFLETPGWKELGLKATDSWEQPWIFAIVRSGNDQVVIHSRDGTGIWPYRFGIDYRPNSEYLTNDGYIFTERGIYRPGEDVRIVGIVRDKHAGEFVIPESLEIEVVITDPKGKEIFKQNMRLSEYGAFHIPLKLAENAKIGTYWIQCNFPFPDYLDLPKDELEWMNNSVTGSFKVEMFRPVEFEVNIDLPKTEYIKGDTATGDIKATYLFGGAVRNVPVEWNLNRMAYNFYSEDPQFDGYNFNVYDRYGGDHVAEKSSKLDDHGEYRFEYTLADSESGSYSYSLDATVTDVNQRQVSMRKNLIVHGGEYYIGLKTKSFFASTDEDFFMSTIAITPEEELLAGQEYQVQLKRIWWESVRRAGNGGRLYWESEQKEEIVQEFQVQSAFEPVELSLPIEKVGYYKVEANGKDARGNEIRSEDYFYAIGSGYAAWMRQDDDYVELIPSGKEYQPGDTAKILVKSPYETVKALVTVEREGVIDRWVEIIEGSADTIDIPIKPEYIPNVYIGVILIQERIAYDKIEGDLDLGKPGFKIGYTGIPVNPAERHLQVAITTDHEEYRPGTEVEVQLQVTDKDQQGREAEVVLSVVDVGVLNLINYTTPDPFEYFYRSRPLGVLTSELRNSIVGQRNYSQKGERQAGGGVDAAAMLKMIQLREKFKPTAYHNPEVRTGANGRATVRFTLPDNLTSFRIMATAHTKDSFFGAGDKRIKVNKKLMLTSSLPAFLRIGDTIQAGILAHNRTEKDGAATIQTETEGLMLASPDIQQLTIPQEDKQEVLFSYQAEEEREVTLIFRGKMEDETDGLKVTLPVLLNRLPLTTALFGSTTEDLHREFVAVPEDAAPGWGSVKFSLASTQFTDIKGSAEYLFGYPYGCLEQQISRILPIILSEDLITAFTLEVFKDEDYKTVVQKTLDQFSAYQHSNGGFGYWKRPYSASPFVSAYAVFTLAMAKSKGYSIDEEMEQKALTYLENVLKGQNERATIYRYNTLAWNVTDAFILYALTLYDKYQPAYATRLYDVRDRLPVFGK